MKMALKFKLVQEETNTTTWVRVRVKGIRVSECQVNLVFNDDLSNVVVSFDSISGTELITYEVETEVLRSNSGFVHQAATAVGAVADLGLLTKKHIIDPCAKSIIQSHTAPKVRWRENLYTFSLHMSFHMLQ